MVRRPWQGGAGGSSQPQRLTVFQVGSESEVLEYRAGYTHQSSENPPSCPHLPLSESGKLAQSRGTQALAGPDSSAVVAAVVAGAILRGGKVRNRRGNSERKQFTETSMGVVH